MRVVVFLLALLMAACGSGGSIVDPPAQGQQPPAAAPPPAIRAELGPVAGDFTPVFDAEAQRSCASLQDRVLDLAAGRYEFRTQPRPIPCALRVVGPGIGAVYLVRAGDFLTLFEWVRGTDHGGGGIEGVTIAAARGTNGGVAVRVTATPDTDPSVNYFNRHIFTMEDVQIGREGGQDNSWDYGLVLDGSQNPENTQGIAPGIRDFKASHLLVSGTRIASVLLDHAKGAELAIQCYIPLPGSAYGLVIRNQSEGTRLDSRNCPYRMDDTSAWVQLNGRRTEAKTGDPSLLP